MLKTISPRRRKFSIPRIVPTGCEQPVSETLPGAVRRIARRLRPDKIILFGSYAYGKPTPDRDVDLLGGDEDAGGFCRALPVCVIASYPPPVPR